MWQNHQVKERFGINSVPRVKQLLELNFEISEAADWSFSTAFSIYSLFYCTGRWNKIQPVKCTQNMRSWLSVLEIFRSYTLHLLSISCLSVSRELYGSSSSKGAPWQRLKVCWHLVNALMLNQASVLFTFEAWSFISIWHQANGKIFWINTPLLVGFWLHYEKLWNFGPCF